MPNSLPLSTTKYWNWMMFLPIYNNLTEQNCFGKAVFNNVSRLNYSSLMNNTVTNKIKHFRQLFPLEPQINLKRKWCYFLVWSAITTKLDI